MVLAPAPDREGGLKGDLAAGSSGPRRSRSPTRGSARAGARGTPQSWRREERDGVARGITGVLAIGLVAHSDAKRGSPNYAPPASAWRRRTPAWSTRAGTRSGERGRRRVGWWLLAFAARTPVNRFAAPANADAEARRAPPKRKPTRARPRTQIPGAVRAAAEAAATPSRNPRGSRPSRRLRPRPAHPRGPTGPGVRGRRCRAQRRGGLRCPGRG